MQNTGGGGDKSYKIALSWRALNALTCNCSCPRHDWMTWRNDLEIRMVGRSREDWQTLASTLLASLWPPMRRLRPVFYWPDSGHAWVGSGQYYSGFTYKRALQQTVPQVGPDRAGSSWQGLDRYRVFTKIWTLESLLIIHTAKQLPPIPLYPMDQQDSTCLPVCGRSRGPS